MKKILIAISVLLLLIAGGAVIAVQHLLDADKVKMLLTQIVQQETGRDLKLNGTIEHSLGLSPTLIFNDIALSNAPWGKAESLAAAEKLSVSFKLIPLLSGDFQIDELTLEGAHVALERKGEAVNWAFERQDQSAQNTAKDKASTEAAATAQRFMVTHASAKDSQLSFRDHANAEAISLDIKALDIVELNRTQFTALTLDALFQDAKLTAKVQKDNELVMIDASLANHAASFGAKGSLSLSDSVFDLLIEADSAELRHLLALAGSAESTARFPLSFKGSIGGTPEIIKISALEGLLDKQAFKASGKIDLTTAIPAIEGALSFASLDMTQGATAEAAADENTAASESSDAQEPLRSFSDEPLPLEHLGAFNANVALHIGALPLKQLTLSNISAQMKLLDKTLSFTQVKAETSPGSITGDLQINAQQSIATLSSNLNMQGVDFGKLVAGFSDNEALKGGLINATLTLGGRGESIRSIMATATGALSLYAENATYETPSTLVQAADFFALLRGNHSGNTVALQCAVADWDIKEGIAQSQVIAIKSDGAIVNGKGSIDLREEQLRIGLKARSSLVGFADVVPPLMISGSWHAPSVTLDAAQGLFEIGKFALGAATGVGLVAVLGEKVTDKLGITATNNPCLDSIAKAEEEAAKANADPKATYKAVEDDVRGTRDSVKDSVKTIEEDVKGLRDGLKGLLKP